MKIPVRSILMAGVTTLTASALVIAPSVQPPPPPRPEPAIQLAANVELRPTQQSLLEILLSDPARLLGPATPIGTIPPPPAPIAFAIAPNLADTIDNIYLAVEPWVRYGFQVATDIVSWIPYVGWFAGQIMVFYTFFEGKVASGVFNITDFLRGDGGVIENVVDFGIDVGLAFIWLGLDEWQLIPSPLPPCCRCRRGRRTKGVRAPTCSTLLGLTETPEVGVANAAAIRARGLLDRRNTRRRRQRSTAASIGVHRGTAPG